MSVLAIDQGTSATKAVVWSDAGLLSEVDVPVTGLTFSGDAVEQDPEAVWESIVAAGRKALDAAGVPVRAVAIGNQGETVLAWDRSTGRALGPAVSWQDRRASVITDALTPEQARMLEETTGLPVDPYFAAPKMAWVRRHLPDTLGADVVVTTLDVFLNHRLCGAFTTDAATASRTQLLDPRRLTWSEEALAAYDLPTDRLPHVAACDEVLGSTTAFGGTVTVAGAIVDQQAALYAQGCTEPGAAKCTYGTGAFLLANVGSWHGASRSGLATSIAWAMADGTVDACVDGQVYSAGSGVTWLQRVGLIPSPDRIDAMAASVPDTAGVRFEPAFAGRGAPHWEPGARAEITGLSLSTRPEHIVRAFVQGLADEVSDLARAVEGDLGSTLSALRVDGGLTRSEVLMQLQADALGIPVEVYPHTCATALGIAALALRALDGPAAADAIVHGWQPSRVYEPSAT